MIVPPFMPLTTSLQGSPTHCKRISNYHIYSDCVTAIHWPFHKHTTSCWYCLLVWTHRGDRFLSFAWWRHQIETPSALLAICAGNSTVPGEFPTQRPVTRGSDVFFDLHPNKRLSKQSWGRWFETPSGPLWRHCNGLYLLHGYVCILYNIFHQDS